MLTFGVLDDDDSVQVSAMRSRFRERDVGNRRTDTVIQDRSPYARNGAMVVGQEGKKILRRPSFMRQRRTSSNFIGGAGDRPLHVFTMLMPAPYVGAGQSGDGLGIWRPSGRAGPGLDATSRAIERGADGKA